MSDSPTGPIKIGDEIEDVVCQSCGKIHDSVKVTVTKEVISTDHRGVTTTHEFRRLGWICCVCGTSMNIAPY